jgi:hypothetical protein
MKPQAEMIEGPEAFTRFREAAKKLLSTPKHAAPNPFGKRKNKTREGQQQTKTVMGAWWPFL